MPDLIIMQIFKFDEKTRALTVKFILLNYTNAKQTFQQAKIP